jgi:hypothetical protein
MVIAGGKTRVAQYGQWDGYPSGQGIRALRFLRDKLRQPRFFERLDAVRFVTQEEIESAYTAAGHDGGKRVSDDVAARFDRAHPFMTRDHGASILELIQNSDGPVLVRDSSGFAGESRMCEYAWVIDFDAGTFEMFRGFTREPLASNERFAQAPTEDTSACGTQYYQVKLAHTFMLDKLPSDEEFLMTTEPPSEDDNNE